jgi:hypothetical protein
MITAKNIIELIEKEKLLVYFTLLWAGSFFFWNIGSEVYYATHFYSALNWFAVFNNLIELFVGVMLGILGFKMLCMKFLPTLTKEKLLVYFLLLWAGSFFFWAIYDIVDFGPMSAQAVFSLLDTVCDLVAGAVLALFGWKLLTNKEQNLPPPPP